MAADVHVTEVGRGVGDLSMLPGMRQMLSSLLILLALSPVGAAEPSPLDLKPLFGRHDAAMVLHDVRRNITRRYGGVRCDERLTPCSTFKIPHAIIALHHGVLSGPDHLRKWDGVPTWNPGWNRDHTLATAIRDSALWYFQATAGEIGEARMRDSLAALGYGNGDITGGLTQFWLDSSLKISAGEQVAFLRSLVARTLPLSREAQDVVAPLLIQPQYKGPGTLYAKTGSGGTPDGPATVGWYVGWLEREGDIFVFATNVKQSPAGHMSGRTIRPIIMQMLPSLTQ